MTPPAGLFCAAFISSSYAGALSMLQPAGSDGDDRARQATLTGYPSHAESNLIVVLLG